jgi:catalase-peroxidase
MGPKSRYLGPEVPDEDLIWQDPIPEGNANFDIEALKLDISNSSLSVTEMIETAWASASTFRGSDLRGGANGARIRLAPQKDWEANKPKQLQAVLGILEPLAVKHNASLADTIVLAGGVAIEKVSGKKVPFSPGRGDASQEQTDIESFAVLEPLADGFRNYQKADFTVSPEEMMLDKGQLLNLTASEMTVLVGGLRSLGVSTNGDGIWNQEVALNTSWFNTLLDMSVKWSETGINRYEATDRTSGKVVRTASRCDLVFGSNSQLRAIVEVYAQNDNSDKFISDFISSWVKVMNADRFD